MAKAATTRAQLALPKDLEVVYRDPATLKGYAKNARTHSQEQIAQIRRSIDAYGFTNPILLRDDGVAIGAGHGRQEAALLAPPLQRVPTIIIPGLTEDQWRAYVLADNKIALNSGWDETLLRNELAELKGLGFDMALTGFGSIELVSLFSTKVGKTDPDQVPPIPETPVSRPGDLWRLGEHWIICGSSTDPTTVERVLGGARPHLMVTDPPYGVEYDAAWRDRALAGVPRADGKVGGGASATAPVLNDKIFDWREAWALFTGDVAYVWHAGVYSAAVAISLEATGFQVRSQIIWSKSHFAIGRGDYHWQHEPCWYVVRKGSNGHFTGGRKQTTVWEMAKPAKSETGHSTQKPVEAMRRPIENNSKAGDHVYEPFSGSGTTIIAGQMTGRAVHAIELNPAYVDIAIKRWSDFTGLEAFHEDGRPFSDVAASRMAELEVVG